MKLTKELKDKALILLEKGLKPGEVARKLQLSSGTVYHINKQRKEKANTTQLTNIILDPDQYDNTIVNTYKELSLRIAHTITDKDIKKASLSQRVTAMGILQDKINLKEGKSTENISQHIIHSLNPKQLEQLTEFGKSLIKSMLID